MVIKIVFEIYFVDEERCFYMLSEKQQFLNQEELCVRNFGSGCFR